MEYYRAPVCINYFGNSREMLWRHENPVSYYVEKDGETKFWDAGQCEILEEGSYSANDEEDSQQPGQHQQGWGVISWNPNNAPLQGPFEADDQDLQIALALSEEDAHPVESEDLTKSLNDDLNGGVHDEEEHHGPRHGAEEVVENQQIDQHFDQRDAELAARFSDPDSAPVLRVNADMPFVGGSEDKQRLLDRLSYYGLSERHMAGDGNCQFRALSDQLYRTPEHHMFVRSQVVAQLATAPERYLRYVPMDYNKYMENMARDGEWGDHVTLQAAADFYGMKISLITSFKETCFIEIIPAQQKSLRGLYLSFWSEIHYNSICLLEDNNGNGNGNDNVVEDQEWVYLDD